MAVTDALSERDAIVKEKDLALWEQMQQRDKRSQRLSTESFGEECLGKETVSDSFSSRDFVSFVVRLYLI